VNGRRQISVRGLGGQVLSEFESQCDGALVWQRDLIYAGSRLIGSVKNATPRPAVALAAATSSVAENGGNASVLVQLATSAPLACPVSVSYQTGNGGAFAPLFTHAAGVAATQGMEQGAEGLAGAYYHYSDGRFKAWGKYSKVLVPRFAANIRTWASRADAVGWAVFDAEIYKGMFKCAEMLR
jgi:hypothetical protein